ncbi:hypothetical protein JoomaDRAFT_0656 [Galbibacter orientalis DSM 19592]|mgnify:FL=1|uniref:YHS domain-containing protein n=1 Tax=Galbibacter orientalis DSM 19592 TaxID=926559 RepID=I3C252_9FLAO|nr:YHS domain-containing (seleno)protein [Galbibacter orientalis]EIJ37695.1 hypothetical protein JoomaDRAFT_0656 [Galbibacter orientalis DSM 19592]
MKTLISLFLLLTFSTITAQSSIDYNTKKGAVAQGYDVVSYFEGKPTKGIENLAVVYDNAKFLFTSEAHLKAFKNSPKKYIPQYGGYCAYAIASGEKVRINPETYEIRNGKLYLFYNAGKTNTLTLWAEEGADRLAERADKYWESIKYK